MNRHILFFLALTLLPHPWCLAAESRAKAAQKEREAARLSRTAVRKGTVAKVHIWGDEASLHTGVGRSGVVTRESIALVFEGETEGSIHQSINYQNRYIDSIIAGDRVGIDKLIAEGGAFRVREGCPVVVLKEQPGERDMNWIPTGPLGTRKVRVIEGANTGKTGWIAARNLIPIPTAEDVEDLERARKDALPRPGPIDRSAQAASLLRQARALDQDRSRKGALSYYRRVVNEFPGTAEAEEAAGRIKAIESGRDEP